MKTVTIAIEKDNNSNCDPKLYQKKNHKCSHCDYRSVRRWSVVRHIKRIHKNMPATVISSNSQYKRKSIDNVNLIKRIKENAHDLRLVENFKIYQTGPSRCGKTLLVSQILSNLDSMCKSRPEIIIYVYATWQDKYEMEMNSIVDVFIEDDENLKENIDKVRGNKRALLVLDDMMNSPNIKYFTELFTVQARHNAISVIFISQKFYDDSLIKISNNPDYLILHKNTRNIQQIKTLAQQMGDKELVNIYLEATKEPYSYLFVDITQDCPPELKYRSHLFDEKGIVRIYPEKSLL